MKILNLNAAQVTQRNHISYITSVILSKSTTFLHVVVPRTIAASDMHLYSVIHRKKLTEYRSSLEFLLLNFSATFLLLDSENLMTCVFHLASASLALQYCCMYSLSDTISSVTDLHDKNIHRMA